MTEHIKYIVDKQILKLQETFQYRFRRYLFSEFIEPNKYCYLKRPTPIQYSLEEVKAEPDCAEVADKANLDQRLEEACKEITSIMEILYWLIREFIQDELLTQESMLTKESSGSIMRDFLKRLSFISIADMYSQFKKSLLHTLFEDFDMKKERYNYEIYKEKSLFSQKFRAVKHLIHVDKSFKLKTLEEDAFSLTQFKSRQKYKNFFDSIKNEEYIYESVHIAQKFFQDSFDSKAGEEISKYRIFYSEKQYKILSDQLEPQPQYFKIEMKKDIKQGSSNYINQLNLKTQVFESTLCQPQNIYLSALEEICHTVLYLNAHIQYLPEYVDAESIEDEIQKAISSIEDALQKTFQQLNELSLKYHFDQAFKKLLTLDVLIKNMQKYSRDSTKVDFLPSRDSFTDFYSKMLQFIKQNKATITDRVRKILSDYEEAIPIGLAQLEIVQKAYGNTSAQIINQIKNEDDIYNWSDTNSLISSFQSRVENQLKWTLDQLKTEDATDEAKLDDLKQSISNIKRILEYLPEDHFMSLKEDIEKKAKGVSNQNNAIRQLRIEQKFEAKDFDAKDIAEAIKKNGDVIDDTFKIKLTTKFKNIIEPVCKEGQDIVCSEKVEPQKILQFMNDRVPKISQFFEDKELMIYDQKKLDDEFSVQVKQNFTDLYEFVLFYIQRKIELGSKAVPSKDEVLQKKKRQYKGLRVILTNYFDALDILDHINQSKYKTKAINSQETKLYEFYSECSKVIIGIIDKLKKYIEHNPKQIAILVDDIIANERLFSDAKFIKTFEINYKEEGKLNEELVITIRDTFRGEEPKKILHHWGKQQLAEFSKIDFVQQANKQNSKHDRSNYYGNFIQIYQELEEVTKRAKHHKFFEYKSIQFSYSDHAQLNMEEKVLQLKTKFVHDVHLHIVNGQEKRLLSQKYQSEVNTIFQKIYSAYQNLAGIIEYFKIIDPSMQAEIDVSLVVFQKQVQTRIKKMASDAKLYCEKPPLKAEQFIDINDLTKFAEIIVEIQLMKRNFTHLQFEIQRLQDEIIEEYDQIQEKKNNKWRIESLIKLLNGQDWGAQIINECSIFQAQKMMDLQKKLKTKDAKEVLAQINGQDIIIQGNNLQVRDNFKEEGKDKVSTKPLLQQKYDVFHSLYQIKLKQLTAVKYNDKGEILSIVLDDLVNEIKNIKLTQQKWDDSNIEKIPQLLSLIFALWSLQKPKLLQKQQSSQMRQKKDIEEEKRSDKEQDCDFLLYLNQPHPAQVIGLMRILGIGYAPEYVDTQKGSEGYFSNFKKIFGNNKTKIRNNLVQIKTGEGKSVTLAVLSIIFALCDFDVRCACYSTYLSDRDFKAFEPMFNILGLNKKIEYNSFNQICEKEINKSGNLRKIIRKLVLKEAKEIEINLDRDSKPQILLIDEVDVFFSESFFGNTYMPQATIKGVEVEALTDYIWENRENDLTFYKVSQTEEYKNVQQLFKDKYEFLLKEAVKQMIVDLLDVEKFKLDVEVEGMHTMDIIDGLVQYKVGDSWSYEVRDSYRTMFAYYNYYNKHQTGKDRIKFETLQKFKAIGINFTELSFAEVPLQFNLLLGVTGTLDTLSNEQQKIIKNVYNFMSKTYAPSVYDIPKHLIKKEDKIQGLKEEILIMNESQLYEHRAAVSNKEVEVVNEMAVKIFKDHDVWFNQIAERIGKLIVSKNTDENQKENKRAVIVFFKSEQILNEFMTSSIFEQFASYEPGIGILTDKLSNNEREKFVNNATIQGYITLSTREFGRGTDFKYHSNAFIEAGGLAVIQAFYSNDYAEEIQIRGRTRRQGTTGSYEIIVSQQDISDNFKSEPGFVDNLLVLDPIQAYKQLHQKRLQQCEANQIKKMIIRDKIKPIHQQNMNHLENIKLTVKGDKVKDGETEKFVEMLKKLNECQYYDKMFKQKERCVKTLVLIDATGSMGSLLKNVQDTILRYFEQVCTDLKQSKYKEDLFKIQIAFYRNYNDGENILKISPWVGNNNKLELKNFVDKESASGGTNISANEAIEIALQHANQDIQKSRQEGDEPVSLIFVIGDQPSNTKQEILRLKYKSPTSVNPSMTDEEAKSKYGYKDEWNDHLQSKYGESTIWETQLDKIKRFEGDDGFKIPVQSFYVSSGNKANPSLEEFYAKLRVNNTEKQMVMPRLLNLNNKESLVVSLSVDTMEMIAGKNPEGGDKLILQKLAGQLHQKQLAFAS